MDKETIFFIVVPLLQAQCSCYTVSSTKQRPFKWSEKLSVYVKKIPHWEY